MLPVGFNTICSGVVWTACCASGDTCALACPHATSSSHVGLHGAGQYLCSSHSSKLHSSSTLKLHMCMLFVSVPGNEITQ